ncbi:MAG TPA: hypothetical protein VLA60_10040 [Nitrospirales bacterium]|nr:hypothetical protein [Nitrospirales bacterium]
MSFFPVLNRPGWIPGDFSEIPVEVFEIRLRKECPEMGWGSWKILHTGAWKAPGMRYDWRGNSLVCCTTLTKNCKKSEFVLALGAENA